MMVTTERFDQTRQTKAIGSIFVVVVVIMDTKITKSRDLGN